MKTNSMTIVFLCLIALTGCKDDGTFDVTVEFADGKPESGDYWAYAKIFQQDSNNRQQIIVRMQPALFTFPETDSKANILIIPKVPSGNNYQLSIELKNENRRNARSLYFGKSRHFSVASDNHEDLLVSLSRIDDPFTIRITKTDTDSQETDTDTEDMPMVDNTYYLNSEDAKIEIVVKEKWLDELALYRVYLASDKDFKQIFKKYNYLTEPQQKSTHFWADDLSFAIETKPQDLYVKAFDRVYELVLVGETHFVVDKQIPIPTFSTSGSSICTKLSYPQIGFSCPLNIKNFNIIGSDSDTGVDPFGSDIILAHCGDSRDLEDTSNLTEADSLCGEDAICTVREQDSDDSFDVKCGFQKDSVDCICNLEVSATDFAGNSYTELDVFYFSNKTLGVVGKVTVDKATAEAGDKITIEFTVSMEVVDLTASVDSFKLQGDFDSNCDSETLECQFIYEVDESADTDGPQDIIINMTDLEGNSAEFEFSGLLER